MQPLQLCRFCHQPVDAQQAFRSGGACGATVCQRRWREELAGRQRESNAQQRTAARQRAISALAIYPLPANIRPLAPLPEWRRVAFGEHLRQIIAAAFVAEPELADVTGRAESEVASAPSNLGCSACSVCAGRCCVAGAEHGMLTVETIQQYRVAHPTATADSILEVYAAHVGEITYEGACIYQGSNGCTLPRNLRATLCNSFQCDELVQLLKEVEAPLQTASAAKPVVLVALDGNVAIRTQLWASPPPGENA